MDEIECARLPKDELFEMLDVIDEMVGFCSCHMPAPRYYAVANAVWVIANRAAQNDAKADELKGELLKHRAAYFAAADARAAELKEGQKS
ncbi:hypothetical protein V5G24_20050 [Xanthobacter sp. VTT E-85241]|uniref:hypothetical protein n=1 Tax=Roseixanthobacter finlandensis TaxID=3119922 RepID=UPI0037291C7F